MNGTFKITGGIPLNGTVTPIPNKNSLMGALPLVLLYGKLGAQIENLES